MNSELCHSQEHVTYLLCRQAAISLVQRGQQAPHKRAQLHSQQPDDAAVRRHPQTIGLCWSGLQFGQCLTDSKVTGEGEKKYKTDAGQRRRAAVAAPLAGLGQPGFECYGCGAPHLL